MAWASTSLPTPLSPRSTTETGLAATAFARSSRSSKAGESVASPLPLPGKSAASTYRGPRAGTLLRNVKNVRPTCARLSSARSALRTASPSTTIPFFDPTSRMVKPSGPRRISAWAFETQPSGSEISRPPSAAMRTARCSPRPIRTTSTPASE